MVQIDLEGTAVLITGGTKGIGLASALKFAEAGSSVYLTCKWGSAEEDDLFGEFSRIGAKKPVILKADVSVDEDTDLVMTEIGKREKKIDFFISNVGFAAKTDELSDYKKRSLFKTLEYSTWPLISYTIKMKEAFGSYPRHIVGISSDGPDHFYTGYDFVAASKALLEFFAKYLAARVFEEGSRVNVLRFGMVNTESFNAIFGKEFFTFLEKEGLPPETVLTPEPCGKAVFALCCGFLDAMNGQIVTVDNGLPFRDNTMMRYLRSRTK
ncbi:MAG: SDR family oxidoreductase [Spirochaetales bacterium]|nr:MAG: SDR family oxidoreductase [Spirochaetales bacterium]